MKDLRDDGTELLDTVSSARVPLLTRVMSIVSGTSQDQLRFVPDTERRTVVLVGLTLLLVLSASTLGWWVALQVARGHTSILHLPFVLLAGGLIYVVDRAMVRQHWNRFGKIQAYARGFDVPDAHGSHVALVIHWILRVSVSVVLGLTTAGFVGLALFEGDIAAQMDEQDRTANKPIYEAAQRRYDDTIAAMQTELAQLDTQIAALLQRETTSATAALAAAQEQIAALSAERASLQRRISELETRIDCIATDKIAEETGGVRCNGSRATEGKGNQWEAANQLLGRFQTERVRAQARVAEIDKELTRLQNPPAPANSFGEGRLAFLTGLRSERLQALNDFTAERTFAVRSAMEADARFVTRPEGLIERGEALDALAKSSPWLAMRIWLVFGSMTILDLAAVIVLSLLPPPLGLTIAEALASETAAHQIIARHESLAGSAKKDALTAREATVRAEMEADERIGRFRTTINARRHMSAHFDSEIEQTLRERHAMV